MEEQVQQQKDAKGMAFRHDESDIGSANLQALWHAAISQRQWLATVNESHSLHVDILSMHNEKGSVWRLATRL